GSNPWSVAVGDFNRDGDPDLATANYLSNNVSVLLNECDSATRTPTITLTPTLTPTSTATPDPCAPGWQNVPSPNQGAYNSVAAVSSNDVWAVGYRWGATLTGHSNGRASSSVASANWCNDTNDRMSMPVAH